MTNGAFDRLFGEKPQPDQSAPVLAEQVDVVEFQLIERRAHPAQMSRVGVITLFRGLVRSAEADQIGRHTAHAGPRERRDHLPVEITPTRLAVQQQHHRAAARTVVDEVHPQRTAVGPTDVEIVGGERVVGQSFGICVRCPKRRHRHRAIIAPCQRIRDRAQRIVSAPPAGSESASIDDTDGFEQCSSSPPDRIADGLTLIATWR